MSTHYDIKQEILSKFKCDRCGECCKIRVYVKSEDILRLAKRLRIKSGTFAYKYIQTKGRFKFLKDPCLFLTNNECSVYNARPDVCRLYPFKLDMPVLQDVEGCNLSKDIYNVAQEIEQIKSSKFMPQQEFIENVYKKRFGDKRGEDSTKDIIFSYEDLEYLAKELRKRKDILISWHIP